MTRWRVRIRSGNQVCGAGVLINDSQILTCAHVINQALHRGNDERTPPQGEVELDFPSLRRSQVLTAMVMPDYWMPINADGRGDAALLTLTSRRPAESEAARLQARVPRGTPVHVYGHPRGHDDGVESAALVGGPSGPGGEWLQLNGHPDSAYRIQRGFSGAGVVDTASDAVVGLLVSAANDADATVSWMLPVSVIVEYWPQLHASTSLDTSPLTTGGTNTLPPTLRDFSGRRSDLSRLWSGLTDQPHTSTVWTISGMGGVGKTSLAVEFAHQLIDTYPDGQLFLDLQAYSDAEQPLEPEIALARLLRMLRVTPDPLPDSVAEWSARWRAELAHRKVVVILDNAESVQQVRPLLPGTAHSLALITSRRRLIGVENAQELPLDVLSESDARQLFTQICGEERVRAEIGAVYQVLALCGYLPLAIRLVASRFRAHPTWRMTDLLRRIRGEHSKLESLRVDGNASVRAAFALSYLHLDADVQRFFRRLGAHPTAEFSASAAMALTGVDRPEGHAVLEQLTDFGLLREIAWERFRLHDLMHEYAAERLRAQEPIDQRLEALQRLLAYYLASALAAHAALLPFRPIRDAVPAPPTELPDVHTASGALAWFTEEQANLIACVHTARENGLMDYVWRIPRALNHYLGVRTDVKELNALHDPGLAAAHAAGDVTAIADLETGIADLEHALGRSQAALSTLDTARRHYLETGDRLAVADVTNRIGRSLRLTGRHDEARMCHEKALATSTELDDPYGQAESHHYLGLVARVTGMHESALTHQRKAVDLYRELSYELGEARSLQAIGVLHRLRGEFLLAVDQFDTALTIYRRNGDQRGIANTLNNTASALLLSGDLAGAQAHVEEAIEIFRRIGNRNGESDALVVSGRIHRAMGRFADASVLLRQSLTLAEEMSTRSGQANALLELSRTLRADGRLADALVYGERALAVYRSTKSARGIALSRLELAHSRYELHDPDALDECKQALSLCQENGLTEIAEARALLQQIDS